MSGQNWHFYCIIFQQLTPGVIRVKPEPMKLISYSFLLLFFSTSFVEGQTFDDQTFFDLTKKFMVEYTRGDLVDYAELKKSPELLDSLVEHIANFKEEGKSDLLIKAYCINAYNVLVIKQVVDNYPIKSPNDIDGFFSKVEFVVGGKKMTLDYLQHELITKRFSDERVHFALACASQSCPLMDAYDPDQLDLELNVAREQFLGMEKHIKVTNEKIYISKIFNWYKDEFINASFKKTIRHYINSGRYENIPEEIPIVLRKYDWSLNEF